jgi:hypothetical protein
MDDDQVVKRLDLIVDLLRQLNDRFAAWERQADEESEPECIRGQVVQRRMAPFPAVVAQVFASSLWFRRRQQGNNRHQRRSVVDESVEGRSS